MTAKILKIIIRFKYAWDGQKEWIRISKLYKMTGKEIVLFMPHSNCKYNEVALKYLEYLDNQRQSCDILIFSFDKLILNKTIVCNNKKVKMIVYPYEKMKKIMACYCLYKFYPYLYFVSLTEPEGNSGEELIGFKGTTVEELIYTSVFRLPYRRNIFE